jgi:hypothetical protein
MRTDKSAAHAMRERVMISPRPRLHGVVNFALEQRAAAHLALSIRGQSDLPANRPLVNRDPVLK